MNRDSRVFFYSLTTFFIFLVFFPLSASAANPSVSGLIEYWSFDDNSGTTASNSTSSNNAILLNGPTWVTGRIGSALSFSGASTNVATTGVDSIGTGDVTFSAWLYAKSTGGSSSGVVISNSKFILSAQSFNSRLQLSSNGGGTSINAGNGSLILNQWFHVVITRTSAGVVNFYENNVATGTPNQSSGTPAVGVGETIGNRPIGTLTTAWDGYIDDLRIYNRILTTQEIADLYNATTSYPDSFPPTRSAGSPSGVLSSGTTQTTISLTTDESATCKYDTLSSVAYASMANTFSTTGGTSHSTIVTGLTDSTSYNYYVRCQDGSSNANTSDYIINFSIADIVAPVVSNVTVANIYQTSAIITWTTDESATSTVYYGATSSYGSASTSASYVTSHSITITGLSPSTTYHFSVSSADLSNNISTSSDATFTTTSRDTWYVDASATGIGNGTSLANAWTSFASINQSQLNANDVVLIYSGTYDEKFTISKSGTSANARIIYKGVDDGGGMPVLRGIDGGTYDYIGVIGLEIAQYTTNYNYSGISLSGSDGWLLEDNYIHDIFGSGIVLVYGTVNNNNIIRHNTLNRLGLVTGSKYGGAGILVFGDSNLIEYNTVGLANDFFLPFGSGNIIRNNYTSYTSELEFMDGINGTPRPLATTTAGSWDSSTGVWTKAGADVSSVSPNMVIRIYPDGGDSYGFSSVVTSTSTNTITVRLTDYVGTIPTSGTGNRSAIVVSPVHIDCLQSYSSTSILNKILVENNLCENNNSANSHGLIIQDDGTHGLGWLVQRGNVYYNLGSATHLFTGFTRAWIYNNTFYNPLLTRTTIFNTIVSYSSADSVNHSWINNTWDETGQSSSQALFASGSNTGLYADYNHVYGGNTLNYGSNNSTSSPLFTDPSTGNLTLQTTSPLKAIGRYMTLANGSGASSVTLIVDDAYPFSDGWGISQGDLIKIGGGSYVRISSINYGTNTITLASPMTWSDNDPVVVKGMDDMGALPYDYTKSFNISLDNTYLPTGSINLTASVDNTDAVRMVEYLVDGIPVGISYTSPYTVPYTTDGESHSVTARAYNAWASSTLSDSDTRTLPGASAPTVTTQAASSLAQTTVTLNGNITATGGSNATTRGFAYGTSATLATTIATTSSSGSFSTGAYTTSVSSLTCNTAYYARAYATNPSGTSFGSIVSFTTSACAAAESDDTPADTARTKGTSATRRAQNLTSKTSQSAQSSSSRTQSQAPTFSQFIDILISVGAIPPERAEQAKAAVSASTASPSSFSFTRDLQLHDKGSDVSALQSLLISKGYLAPGNDVGTFGPMTFKALKLYQASLGLPQTGYFGPLTRGSMGR